jgi:hydroxyethylthiazole kinase-like uncharacterized protein yjeF
MFAVTSAEMRQLDRLTIEKYGVPSLTLMEHAGERVVDAIVKRFPRPVKQGVLVIVGKGNNGGDGLVIARLLRRRKVACEVVCLAPRGELSPDAKANLKRYLAKRGVFTEVSPGQLDLIEDKLRGKTILVDALLGTGLRHPVAGFYGEVIDVMNASGLPIVAVDVPSGLDSDRGQPLGATVKANLTVTFGLPKIGQLTYPGVSYVGELVVADIGIRPEAVAEVGPRVELLAAEDLRSVVPRRAADAHKGDHGHILVMAGSRGKTGAALLACRAAMRVGAGLVTLAAPRALNDILAGALLESMTEALGEADAEALGPLSDADWVRLLGRKDVVLFGPGIGVHSGAQRALEWLLANLDLPWLIDADGLNNLAENTSRLRDAKVHPVLTPHPGEMGRLTGMDAAAVNRDRVGIARQFSQEYQCYLALKGARTVMATPEGRVFINPTGNPGMATAGMGDVLSGIIAGLMAQRLSPEDAMRLGVFLHGWVGDRVARSRGMVGLIASDIIEGLPRGIRKLA